MNKRKISMSICIQEARFPSLRVCLAWGGPITATHKAKPAIGDAQETISLEKVTCVWMLRQPWVMPIVSPGRIFKTKRASTLVISSLTGRPPLIAVLDPSPAQRRSTPAGKFISKGEHAMQWNKTANKCLVYQMRPLIIAIKNTLKFKV